MNLLDGRALANHILKELKTDIAQRGIMPGLAVILVGNDPASVTYVSIKAKRAQEIGMYFEKIAFPETVSAEEIITTIEAVNQLPKIDGIIIQLPLPQHLDADAIYEHVDPKKDVDGFHPQTTFTPPIAMGVNDLLAHTDIDLRVAKIVVLGKGKTAGQPIIDLLKSRHLKPIIVSSQTGNLKSALAEADVIISAVGKPGLITGDLIKTGVTIIDAATTRQTDGTLVGDVNQASVADKAVWLTPVPGGVGPMTVACLLQNTLTAALLNRI